MRHRLAAAVIAASLVLTGQDAAAQSCSSLVGNLVVNCSFENPGPSAGPNYQFLSELPGWSVSGGRFERWSNGFNGFASRDGAAHLELDSDVGNTTIWQYLSTVAGRTYTVTFSAAHRSLNGQFSQLQVLFDDDEGTLGSFTTPQLTDATPGVYQWVTYQTSFVASGASTRLAFRGTGPSNTYGDHLDNVSVVGVPEPASMTLVASGLVGIGLAARRRRRA